MSARSLKPTVLKRRSLNGRRIVGYTATIGHLEARGATPSQAETAVVGFALDAIEDRRRGIHIARVHGRRYVVSPSRYSMGWDYWLDGMAEGVAPGCAGPYASKEEAIDRAQHHASQNAWSAAVEDDSAFLRAIPSLPARRDLASWIGWQRAYDAAMREGLPTEECREYAARPGAPFLQGPGGWRGAVEVPA